MSILKCKQYANMGNTNKTMDVLATVVLAPGGAGYVDHEMTTKKLMRHPECIGHCNVGTRRGRICRSYNIINMVSIVKS